MPENAGEPLEVLSVGIEADIRDLLNGARKGVQEAAEILSELPVAEFKGDPRDALKALMEIAEGVADDINLMGDLSLSATQMGRVVREGAEEGATALQRMAAQILEVLAIDAPPMLAENYGLSEEEFRQAVEYLNSLGDAFRGSELDAALFVQAIADAEAGLGRLELQMELPEVEIDPRPLLASINGFIDLGLTSEEATDLIIQGSREGATELERLGATLAEMSQIPSLALHLYDFVERMGVDAAKLAQIVDHIVETVGRVPRFDLSEAERLEQELGSIEKTLMSITLSADEMAQLVQQGMRANATETELWGRVLATELQESMAMGMQFQEALEETVMLFYEAGELAPEMAKRLGDMVRVMQAFPEDFGEWDLEPVAVDLGGIERHLSVVLTAQERINEAVEQGVNLRGNEIEGLEELTRLLHVATLTQPEFQKPSWSIWEEGSERVAGAMRRLTLTQEALDAVIRTGTTEGADAYSQMAAVVARVSEQTDLSLEDVLHRMMSLSMISRETGLAIAQAFKSAAQGVEESFSAFYRLDQMLHGLPSAQISEVAKQFVSDIKLMAGELEASAKDVGEIEVLQVPAGRVISFEVEGEDALEALEAIQTAMIRMNLISKEAAFSVEELVAGMAGPKFVEPVGTIEEIVEGFMKVRLTASEMDQVVRDRAEGVGELAAELVEYARSFNATLGDMAAHFSQIGRAGLGPLQEVLAMFQELEKARDYELPEIVPPLGDAGDWIGEVVPPLEAAAEAGQEAAEGFGETQRGIMAFAKSAREAGEDLQITSLETTQAVEEIVEVFYTLTEQMLHARPAAVLAASMRRMSEEVKVAFAEVETSAKSMIGLLTLGVPMGGEIKITVDAEEAVQTLQGLERAMVDAQLITEEATHSLEELGTVVLGPQLVDSIGEVLHRFELLEDLDLDRVVWIINNSLSEAAGGAEKLAGMILEFAVTIEDSFSATMAKLWSEEAFSPAQAAAALDFIESLGEEYRATTDQVEDFMESVYDLADAHRLQEMKGIGAGGRIWEDGDVPVITFEETLVKVDQILQEMFEHTREGLLGNEELFSELGQRIGGYFVLGSQQLHESLTDLQAAMGEADLSTEELVKTAAQAAPELSGLLESVAQLGQITGLSLGEAMEALRSFGVVSDEVFTQTISLLQQIAETHINPSPLADSIEGIIEALNRLNAALDIVPERLKRIAYTPLEIDLTQVEQLTLPRPTAVIPTGQVEHFMKMAQGLPMIFRPMEPLLDQIREGIGKLFTTMREGIASAVPRIQQIVAGFFQVGEAASAATIGVQQCNQIIEQGAETSATEIQRLMALIVRLSQVSGESFESIAQGMATSGTITKTQLKGIQAEVGGLGKGTEGLGGIFKTLGGVAQSVFGVALGISAVQAIRRLVREIKETVEISIKLQAAMMRLDVAVHTVQRTIGAAAGTMGDWRAYVKELQAEFTGLSEVALTDAASMVVFLTRELGFNEEQMQDVLRTASILASVYDVEVGEAVGRVVRALTGYGRGLYSLGIFLSRATLDAEAFTMGLNKTWSQLTAEERAMVALNVIMRQTEPVVEDLDIVMGSLGGQMQTVTARTADARAEIGGLFAPAVVLAKNGVVWLVEVVAQAATAMSQLVASVAAGVAKLYYFIELTAEGVPLVEAMTRAHEMAAPVFVEWSRSLGLIPSALEDIREPMEGLTEELEQDFGKLLELAQEYGDQFADAIGAWTEGSEDAWNDLQEGLSELAEELSADLTESFEDFMRDLEDLAEEYADRRQGILEDYQRDLAELERDRAKDRRKDETDHYRDLIRLQEDYQRDARRLRERFIQTLKDAVAKRDVWGAIQAIRTYARDARYLKEDYETRRARMIEDFNARMIELDRQFEEKRRKIEEDKARELAELEIWLAERRAELEEDRAEREQKLRDSATEQEQELRDSYDKRLRDLEQSLTNRMLAIAQGMADEEELTAAGAQAVLMALFRVFGYGGDIDQLMDAFQQRMARRIDITVQVTREWGDVGAGAVPGMAEGGTFVAREPTMVMFGEAGTEIATFTPLNQLTRIDHTQRNLGLLDIKVSADEHFSIDFERRVEDAIASFVGGVIQ